MNAVRRHLLRWSVLNVVAKNHAHLKQIMRSLVIPVRMY